MNDVRLRTDDEATGENQSRKGIVYTFYSFKGGAGRSMALANVAALLSQWGRKVLIVDWDLEAPGIENFFIASTGQLNPEERECDGVCELLTAQIAGDEKDWRDCLLEFRAFPDAPTISIIPAGRRDNTYFERVQSLSWEALLSNPTTPDFFEALRDDWTRAFDFVLIDSRTGVNDIGGICAVVLPDILITLFNTTLQSINGTADVVRRAQAAQLALPLDRGRLFAVPVLSRDESQTEYKLADEWRRKAVDALSEYYAAWLPAGKLPTEVANKLYIPYIAYWSFGERLPVVEEYDKRGDPRTIVAAYVRLAKLIDSRLNWGLIEAVEPTVPQKSDSSPIFLYSKLLSRSRDIILRFASILAGLGITIVGVLWVIEWSTKISDWYSSAFSGVKSQFLWGCFGAALLRLNSPPMRGKYFRAGRRVSPMNYWAVEFLTIAGCGATAVAVSGSFKENTPLTSLVVGGATVLFLKQYARREEAKRSKY